jgi:ABC-type multidrug transport system fused ATPase/permease subunit
LGAVMQVNDESYLVKKVDEIANNITNLLVVQSTLNEKIENISKVTSQNETEVKDHAVRITRIESTMLILKWILGVFTVVLGGVIATIIIRAIGG